MHLQNFKFKDQKMKKLIMDLDDTICVTVNGDYMNSLPKKGIIAKLQQYKQKVLPLL